MQYAGDGTRRLPLRRLLAPWPSALDYRRLGRRAPDRLVLAVDVALKSKSFPPARSRGVRVRDYRRRTAIRSTWGTNSRSRLSTAWAQAHVPLSWKEERFCRSAPLTATWS